jgi:hypothetical protein
MLVTKKISLFTSATDNYGSKAPLQIIPDLNETPETTVLLFHIERAI